MSKTKPKTLDLLKRVYPLVVAMVIVELFVIIIVWGISETQIIIMLLILSVWLGLFSYFLFASIQFHTIKIKAMTENATDVVVSAVITSVNMTRPINKIRIKADEENLNVRAYRDSLRIFAIKLDVLTGVFNVETRGRTEKKCYEDMAFLVKSLVQKSAEYKTRVKIVSVSPEKYEKNFLTLRS